MEPSQTSFEIGGNANGAELDPRMRAWYSGRPDFVEGAQAMPSHPEDDVDIALAKMELALDGRVPDGIPTEELTAAVDFLKERTGKTNGLSNGNVVDAELVMAGLCWIKENTDNPVGKNLRMTAIDARKTLQEKQNTTDEMPVVATPPAESQPRPSRRALKRAEQESQRQEALKRHLSEKQSEIDTFTEWRQEYPSAGRNFYEESVDLLETYVSPSGNLLIVETEEYRQNLTSYIRHIAENPAELFSDISNVNQVKEFLIGNKAPTLFELFKRAEESLEKAWTKSFYESADTLREVIPRWLSIFTNFSQVYKDSVVFENYVANDNPEITDPVAKTESYINSYGITIMNRSLIKLAENNPDEFVDVVHDMALSAAKTEDEFTTKNTLYILAGVLALSTTARTLVFNAPIAEGLNRNQRMKAKDLHIAMDEVGCLPPREIRADSDVPTPVRKKYYRTRKLAMELGLDPEDENDKEWIYQQFFDSLENDIKAGKFAESITQQIKRQK